MKITSIQPVLAITCVALCLSCSESSDPEGVTPMSAPPGWAEQATAGGPPASATIGPDGGTVASAEANLRIPPGVFSTPETVRLQRIQLPIEGFVFAVARSRSFLVETEGHHPRLPRTPILEVAQPRSLFAVVTRTNGGWVRQPHRVADGKIEIPIDHFSPRFFSILEWFSSTRHMVESTLSEAGLPKHPQVHERRKIENGGADVRAFYGVGEKAPRRMADHQRELLALIASYPRREQYSIPKGGGMQELGLFLHAANTPKGHGGYYHETTKSSHERIHARLIASRSRLSLAQFLKLSIEASDGNVPRGVLAAHNYLKDITYRARDSWDGSQEMPADAAKAASRLEALRANPLAPGRYYDKMGPIYHVFAAMTATVWGGSLLGDIAVEGEAFLRAFGIGADHPDFLKYKTDECGATVGNAILAKMGAIDATPTRSTPATTPKFVVPDEVRGFPEPGIWFHLLPDDGQLSRATVTVNGKRFFAFEDSQHRYSIRVFDPSPRLQVHVTIPSDGKALTKSFEVKVGDHKNLRQPPSASSAWHKRNQRILDQHVKGGNWSGASAAQRTLAGPWKFVEPKRHKRMLERALEYERRGPSPAPDLILEPILHACGRLNDFAGAKAAYEAMTPRGKLGARRTMLRLALRLTGDIAVARQYAPRRTGRLPEHLLQNRQ